MSLLHCHEYQTIDTWWTISEALQQLWLAHNFHLCHSRLQASRHSYHWMHHKLLQYFNHYAPWNLVSSHALCFPLAPLKCLFHHWSYLRSSLLTLHSEPAHKPRLLIYHTILKSCHIGKLADISQESQEFWAKGLDLRTDHYSLWGRIARSQIHYALGVSFINWFSFATNFYFPDFLRKGFAVCEIVSPHF